MAPTHQESLVSSAHNRFNNDTYCVIKNVFSSNTKNTSKNTCNNHSININSINSNVEINGNINNSYNSPSNNNNSNSSSNSNISDIFNSHTPRLGSINTVDNILLPIAPGGPFYLDPFFSSARHPYNVAVRDVLDKWGQQRSQLENDLTTYRSLRDVDFTGDSQAVTVSENANIHQVVLDVVDFPRECVVVKVVDENELVVEGSVDQREGTSTSTKSFCRSFTFPGLVRPEVITSTMSSDGVLTITVPKKESLESQDINSS